MVTFLMTNLQDFKRFAEYAIIFAFILHLWWYLQDDVYDIEAIWLLIDTEY